MIGVCYRAQTFINAFNAESKISLPDFADLVDDDTVKPLDVQRSVGVQMKRRLKNAAEVGGVSSRTPKQRREAAEHLALLQHDEEGNELPVEKRAAKKPPRNVICKKCGMSGHMQKTCKNEDVRMRVDDFDTHVITEEIPSINRDIIIGSDFATV